MKDSGLSYRAMESKADAGISFARFRDIAQGNKAPVRLSEFLAICDVCGADPVQTVRDILAEARRIEAERAADEMADRIAANPEQFDVAANDDPNKENEATTPRE